MYNIELWCKGYRKVAPWSVYQMMVCDWKTIFEAGPADPNPACGRDPGAESSGAASVLTNRGIQRNPALHEMP